MLRNKAQSEKRRAKFLLFTLSFCLLPFVFCLFCYGQQQYVYDDKAKRNPFLPLVTEDGRIIKLEEEKSSELRLEGIIYDELGLSYAIVNQAVVKIGDWVGDYQVFKIEKNKVTFLKEGQPKVVEL